MKISRKSQVSLFIIFILGINLISCYKCIDPDFVKITKYSTSFENESQLSGWIGIDTNMLIDSTANNCGSKCVLVGGGCIQPAAYYNFIAPVNGSYGFSVWAKGYDSLTHGLITFQRRNNISFDSTEISVQIKYPNWKYYESNKRIRANQGDTLMMNLVIGGIGFDAMYVDKLVIYLQN